VRRFVDASIPLLIVIAVIPAAVQILELPAALERSLGEFIGRLWAITLGIAFSSICVGIALRLRKPAWAFRFEWPALAFAGLISSIYGTSIMFFAGMRGWTPTWFIWAIGAHCLTRFLELGRARRQAASLQP
jgi:hypothetical protein